MLFFAVSVSTADVFFSFHISCGHWCALSWYSFSRHRPLYYIYIFSSFNLSNSLCLGFNLSLCQSSHVSLISILYCYFGTCFWGHSVSHAIINFPHLPLSASRLSVCGCLPFLRCFYSPLFLDPSPLILFLTLPSCLLSLHWYSKLSLSAKRRKYMLLQVCIDLNFVLPLCLWVLRLLIYFPHSVSGNKTSLCMLLLSFRQSLSIFISPSLSHLHWTSLQLMPFCRALGTSLQKTKLPSLFQLRGFNTTSPHNCSHEKYSMSLFEELHKIYESFEDDFV